MSDAQKYRTKAEVAEYKKIDPISQVLEVIKEKKYLTDEQIQAINDDVKDSVANVRNLQMSLRILKNSNYMIWFMKKKGFPFIKHRL